MVGGVRTRKQNMPKAKVGGKVKHFPYTKAGKMAAKKAKSKVKK